MFTLLIRTLCLHDFALSLGFALSLNIIFTVCLCVCVFVCKCNIVTLLPAQEMARSYLALLFSRFFFTVTILLIFKAFL